jgi:hypothetical protein
VKQFYRDTNPKAEKFLIDLIKQKSIPRKLSQMQALSSLIIRLSKNAIRKTNQTLSEHDLNMLFVKYNYGETIFRKLCKYIDKINNETK